ncbi:hypothetical protein MCE39_004863, partial [Salmonella enterica subsp. enterica serovar Poona]|nr:hypothetical protein [Salmonella enterica subsp. enterica serovar Poona]EIW3227525.1 hypothetical protein [Salmonella enterica subsp. enterica serovar Poona]
MLGGADNPNGELLSYIIGADTFQFGKVRQATQARLMPLAEHDLLLCTVLQLPFADPSLYGSAEAVG